MMFQNRPSTAVGLALLVILTLLATSAPAAPLPDFVLTGGAGACVPPATPITDGCQLLIAGTYTDAAGNDFTITDVSTSNKARIQFIEGLVDKLILTGATVKASEQITNATITFKHLFTSTKNDESNRARNSFSGGWGLLFQNTTARTITAAASAELCQVGVGCLTANGNPFTDPALSGSIVANSTVGSYAPLPDEQPYAAPGFASNVLLRGQITISSLRNTERATNLSHTLLAAATANMPPFDGPGVCDGDEDIGAIVRGTTPVQDTICTKSPDGTFILMSGVDALSLAGASCPIAFEQQIDGLKHENQIMQFFQRDTSGF